MPAPSSVLPPSQAPPPRNPFSVVFPRNPLSILFPANSCPQPTPHHHHPPTPHCPALPPPRWRPCPRPCPSCSSPAKLLNNRRAVCRNCGYDFCQNCLHLWHEVNCANMDTDEPNRKRTHDADVNIAGTKKSRKRLKRL